MEEKDTKINTELEIHFDTEVRLSGQHQSFVHDG